MSGDPGRSDTHRGWEGLPADEALELGLKTEA